MKVALVGAELEENLGLRYMASSLECNGHEVHIVQFNSEYDIPQAVKQITNIDPEITGMSMVFTSRAREFCHLAQKLRDNGYRKHVIAGGHFASLNCKHLLRDFPAFDSVGLGEGEALLCKLAVCLDDLSAIPGLCYRKKNGTLAINPSAGNPDNLDALPFPKRTTFHDYFEKPIASILSSRGCWRSCAFCSIDAWYKQGGGKKFRIRSVENIVAEMKELYVHYGVRIFNFQDDNFFLLSHDKALRRFETLRDGLKEEGLEGIAIAVKARPDSITYNAISVLNDLGLFRVFLGVENASENGLQNLNRKCDLKKILEALRILNDFDVHLAYNILMFEPDTTMDDILINLRFIERHIENPFNFCRAEAYAGTGLEAKLRSEDLLLGDYFGFDYRLKEPRSEAFHQIANYAFFDRNFSDLGLHYFNMQVDFYYQLLRRFHPQRLTQTLRSVVKNFIKQTNLDTYECLSQIFDFVTNFEPTDQLMLRGFARDMRQRVDKRSNELYSRGERILQLLTDAFEGRNHIAEMTKQIPAKAGMQLMDTISVPYSGLESIKAKESNTLHEGFVDGDIFDLPFSPMPYSDFKNRLAQYKRRGGR